MVSYDHKTGLLVSRVTKNKLSSCGLMSEMYIAFGKRNCTGSHGITTLRKAHCKFLSMLYSKTRCPINYNKVISYREKKPISWYSVVIGRLFFISEMKSWFTKTFIATFLYKRSFLKKLKQIVFPWWIGLEIQTIENFCHFVLFFYVRKYLGLHRHRKQYRRIFASYPFWSE